MGRRRSDKSGVKARPLEVRPGDDSCVILSGAPEGVPHHRKRSPSPLRCGGFGFAAIAIFASPPQWGGFGFAAVAIFASPLQWGGLGFASPLRCGGFGSEDVAIFASPLRCGVFGFAAVAIFASPPQWGGIAFAAVAIFASPPQWGSTREAGDRAPFILYLTLLSSLPARPAPASRTRSRSNPAGTGRIRRTARRSAYSRSSS